MNPPVAILAGGLATRLGNVTGSIPKSLLDVGGKPFAVHQLDLLRRNGFQNFVFCVGHMGDQIESCLGNGSRWGVNISYAYDGPTLRGTGGALINALPFLETTFLVLYGDSYLDCDYASVLNAFYSSKRLGLMTVFKNHDQWDKSNVVFQDGKIRRYDKKLRVPAMEHIDYGLGILRAQAIQGYPVGSTLDLAKVYQDLIERDQLAGFEVVERFYEIGSLAGLEETRMYLITKGHNS
jgi:NDP-sugar pyrophosphorylase family protein